MITDCLAAALPHGLGETTAAVWMLEFFAGIWSRRDEQQHQLLERGRTWVYLYLFYIFS